MCSWSSFAIALAATLMGAWFALEAIAQRALFPAPPSSYAIGDLPLARLELPGLPTDEAAISLSEPGQTDRLPLVILYCHGNGGDIGRSHAELERLAKGLGAYVAAVEYPGYGVCRGSPSEDALNRAVLAALAFLEAELGFPPSNILLFGRSIGSGPASFAAREYARKERPLAGLILQSPFLSIRAVVRSIAGGALASLVAERFDNARELAEYHGPLLVIHGTSDLLIPHEQGERLYELCPAAPELKRLSLADGADHNRFDIRRQVERPVANFVGELVAPRLPPLPAEPVLEALRAWRAPADSGHQPSGGLLPSYLSESCRRVHVFAYGSLRSIARACLSAWRQLVG